jgi:prepilin signal peptidase PulO-like enzyme (type II secretory pathway)
MEEIFIYIVLAGLGLVLGSFAGAQVWRLRARQLVEDKAAGEEYDKNEYRQLIELNEKPFKDDRSRCLSCHHQLAWYDLVPLVSWLSTKGQCRYCKKHIGYFEPLIELSVAAYFILSFVFWPFDLGTAVEVSRFVIWLISGVMLAILFTYDAKWFLLPDRIIIPLTGMSVLYAGLGLIGDINVLGSLLSMGGAVAILSGLYLLLWILSKGAWIGFGDVKLGVALGLLLGQWELAFLALFLANFIGCLIVIPGLATKKLSRTTQVPFGPMLITGFFLAALFGTSFISWYLSVTSTLML